MKLNNAEFKVFKELEKLEKEGKLDPGKAELLAKLREKKASNALEWWSKYPELLKDAVNVAFNLLAGKPTFGIGSPSSTYFLPGVIRIPYVQTIGHCNDKTDAFNVQMYQLWLYMHRKYRGIGAYQMSDLAIALFAIIDAFGNLAEAERIYATANTYLAGNRNVPYAMAHAMNFDLNDVVNNMADFRYSINLLNRKLKALCLPKGLSMLENRVTLNTAVFKDASNDRAGIFFWDTDYYCVYEAATYTTGGSINYRPHKLTGSGIRTVGTIIDELTEQIDALLLDDDIARICSDIIAAFDGDVESSTEMPEDYALNIVYSEERNLQFHNLSWVVRSGASGVISQPVINQFSPTLWTEVQALGTPAAHYMDIYQENNVVRSVFQPSYSANGIIQDSNNEPMPYYTSTTNLPAYAGTPVFDTWKDSPAAEDVMCGSRFTFIAEGRVIVIGGTTYNGEALLTYGSEICLEPQIITMGQNSAMSIQNFYRQWGNTGSAGIADRYISDLVSKFDWAPHYYRYSTPSSTPVSTPHDLAGITGDLDNFVALPLATLNRLHEVALLSGFKIESVSNLK